jgi:hypothetical protein
MRRKLDLWRALPAGERWLLIWLLMLLPAVGGMLRLMGVRRTYRLLERSTGSSVTPVCPSESSKDSAERMGRIVAIASRHGPYKATCLRQSLALWWLSRRRGLPVQLRIGVGKEREIMQAHAWVELAGTVINDSVSIAEDYVVSQDLDLHRAHSRRPTRIGN